MSWAGYVLIGLLCIAAYLTYEVWTQPAPLEPKRYSGRVAFVIDGDTLQLDNKTKLRLWGVDAPEKGHTGYRVARDQLHDLAQGKVITYIRMGESYDRVVARIYLKDGREINRMMIESKTAKEYCSFSKGTYGACR